MNDYQRAIAELLSARGLTVADLARGIELSEITVQDQIQARAHSHRRCRKIEKFLGAPIWTSLQQFDELRRAEAVLGADPVLTGFQELRRLAIKLRVPNARRLTSKDDLVAAVLAHVDSTPAPSRQENSISLRTPNPE